MKFSGVISAVAAVLLLASCKEPATGRKDCNGVYYWKTSFALDSTETAFLRDNEVGRLYLRFFDVDVEDGPMAHLSDIVPVGTVTFDGPVPEGVEIVPTVFITERAARVIRDIPDATDKIMTRILNMADYNRLGTISEIQLDCDWAESTRDTFFALCAEMRKQLKEKGIILSATIRLHQLDSPAPPVDRGVLMLYNTGNFRSPSTKNSILDTRDAAPFLKGKRIRYGIPLDFAWPVYGWAIWMRDGQFAAIIHSTDFSDSTLYQTGSDGIITVITEHERDGHTLKPGDRIRVEIPSAATILEVKELVRSAFPDEPHSNIIYHLDSTSLSKFNDHEIKSILSD